MYSRAATAARGGNKILDFITGTAMLLLFLYGLYMVWYNIQVYREGFLGDDLLKFKPTPEADRYLSLEELAAINPDVIGWVTLDDTNIDFPIVQGRDNLEYMDLNIYREHSLAGTVFLDCENDKSFTDPYNLLYGHHMDHGAMFGQIVDFLEKDFFDAHATGTLYLLDSTYSIRIFASMEANAYDERVLSINKDPSRMPPLLAFIDNNAAQYRDIGLQGSDTVLCFVTCESGKTNGRALVFARLEQIATRSQGEDAEKKRQEEMGDVQEWFEEE